MCLPAVGRMLILALVLVAAKCPAEGLVFLEQREFVSEPVLPQLRTDRTQVVVNLSGSWEAVVNENDPPVSTWLPGAFWGEATDVEYRRTFSLTDSLQKWNYQLFLPDIHYRVQIWINDRVLSSFTGSHLGFTCDVDRELLKFDGANEIVMRLSSRLSPTASLPLSPQLLQPRNYGGIFSGIFLRGVPKWSIEDARIVQHAGKSSTNVTEAVVRIAHYAPHSAASDSGAVQLAVVLRDSSGDVVAEARRELSERGAEEAFQMTLSLPISSPALWSPDNPVLYQLSAVLLARGDTLHRLTRKVGFKHLEVSGGDFILNGSRLRVQGMDYIAEHLGGGRAVSVSQLQRDMKAMKDLGVNLIRVPFGPPPSALVDIADERGCLLLVEAGVDGVPAPFLSNGKYRQLCEQAYTRLTEQYGDRVSVLGWGIGSQLDWQQPDVQQFAEWLRAVVWAHDGRPCYIETSDVSRTGPADFVLARASDEVSSSRIPVVDREDIPVIISRVGKLVSPGNPEQTHLTAGLVNQADFLIRKIHDVNEEETLDGYIIHAFADYNGASPLFAQPNRKDPYLYGYGIVTQNRTERVAYFKLRDLVQTGQVAPSVPSSPARATPLAFPVAGLAVLLIISVEMRRNNVFRQNLKRVFLHPHGFHMDLRYRRFLHTAQALLLWLLESATLSLILVSILYALRNNTIFDHYLTHFLPWAELKVNLINLIWNPTNAVLYFTAVFLGLILLLAVMVRLVSIPFRERMDMWQAANYVVWSFAALLFVLPAGAILFRLLESPDFMMPSLIYVALGILWCLQRLLGALRIGLGTSAWRIYLAAIVIMGLVIFGGASLLNHKLGTLAYMDHYKSVLGTH